MLAALELLAATFPDDTTGIVNGLLSAVKTAGLPKMMEAYRCIQPQPVALRIVRLLFLVTPM